MTKINTFFILFIILITASCGDISDEKLVEKYHFVTQWKNCFLEFGQCPDTTLKIKDMSGNTVFETTYKNLEGGSTFTDENIMLETTTEYVVILELSKVHDNRVTADNYLLSISRSIPQPLTEDKVHKIKLLTQGYTKVSQNLLLNDKHSWLMFEIFFEKPEGFVDKTIELNPDGTFEI